MESIQLQLKLLTQSSLRSKAKEKDSNVPPAKFTRASEINPKKGSGVYTQKPKDPKR